MNVMWILMIFAIFAGNARSENVNNGTRHHKNTYISVLVDSLRAQQWDEHEGPCLNIMLKILDNADNFTLWAVWILDSLQRPFGHLYGQKYHLGNYDECLNPGRGFLVHAEVPTTQYCLVDVTLTETEDIVKPVDYVWMDHNATTDAYLKKPSKHGRVLSKMQWGVCVPEVCQPSSAAKIARSILQVSHLGALSDSAGVNASYCQRADTMGTWSAAGLTIFIILFLFLSVTTMFCTYYVGYSKAPTSFVGELARSFSLKRNIESLTTVRDEEVKSMNFFRVATCFIVVNIHYLLLTIIQFDFDGLEAGRILEKLGWVLTDTVVVVDTFLALSGLLFTRGMLADKWQNPLKFIWKRYIRLAAALSAMMFYMVTISGQVGDGPLWHMAMNEQKICINHWLVNLLMLGNVLHVDKMCVISTWYVPCDFQLCVFATILFLIYKKNKSLGKYAVAVTSVSSIIIPGLLTYVNDYPAIPFYGIESASKMIGRTDEVWWSMYVPSYCRAGPFVVGGAMGYIMYTYKPTHHLKVIGTLTSYIAAVFSVTLMLLVLACGHHYYLVGEPVGSAIFAAVNRPLWGVAVCILIAVSEYGNLPFLNRVYSWSPLVPLSRLTYGVYLAHVPMFFYIFFSMRTTVSLNIFIMSMSTAGLVVFSLAASLLAWLLVEAPLININSMLLDHTWRNRTTKPIEVNGNGRKKLL